MSLLQARTNFLMTKQVCGTDVTSFKRTLANTQITACLCSILVFMITNRHKFRKKKKKSKTKQIMQTAYHNIRDDDKNHMLVISILIHCICPAMGYLYMIMFSTELSLTEASAVV